MVLYNCECCLFYSKQKNDYNRHLKTKKHQSNMNNSLIPMVVTQKDPEKTQKDPIKTQKDPLKTQQTLHIVDNSIIVKKIKISINC